jgi:regulator of sigma E protease
MGTLVIIAQLILALAILVVLHELGHFIPAKLFKIKVEKFYLFFNPWFSLFKIKKGDTEYGIGWLPLGGYVKIAGMIDESMDTDQMKQPPKPDEFRSKPTWQRLIVMIGGVTVNILLAFFLYAMIAYFWGKDYVKNQDYIYGIEVLTEKLEGENLFMNGDKILAVEGESLDDLMQANSKMLINQAKNYTVERNGEIVEITIKEEGVDYMLEEENIVFRPRIPSIIDSVLDRSLANKTGLKKGDKFNTLNGENVKMYDDFRKTIIQLKSIQTDSFEMVINRNGELLTLSGQFDTSYTFGFYNVNAYSDVFKKTHISYTFGEAIPEGYRIAKKTLSDYISQFKLIFTKKEAVKKVGGFGTIAKIFPTTWDWRTFWSRTAFLSVVLAFMNILPIPALDGGHVMFLLYEMIAGRPPSDKFLEKAQLFGFMILVSLMLLANGNDVYRWITGN